MTYDPYTPPTEPDPSDLAAEVERLRGELDQLRPPQEPRKSRRRWWIVGAIVAVLAIGGITTGVALASSGGDEPYTPIFDQDALAEQTADSDLEEATDLCLPLRGPDVNVGDSGRSLTVDGAGLFAGPDISDVECVLLELGAPDSVVSRIYATRALDGMQDATWGDYAATWTYHPDDGLWIVIEET